MHTSGSLSLTNVKQFLENGTYVDVTNPSDIVMQSVTRTFGGREITFDVFDSTTNFTESRWSRVVAVFVNGHDW